MSIRTLTCTALTPASANPFPWLPYLADSSLLHVDIFLFRADSHLIFQCHERKFQVAFPDQYFTRVGAIRGYDVARCPAVRGPRHQNWLCVHFRCGVRRVIEISVVRSNHRLDCTYLTSRPASATQCAHQSLYGVCPASCASRSRTRTVFGFRRALMGALTPSTNPGQPKLPLLRAQQHCDVRRCSSSLLMRKANNRQRPRPIRSAESPRIEI